MPSSIHAPSLVLIRAHELQEGSQRTTGRITGEDAITLQKLPAHKFVLEHLVTLFDSKLLSWFD